MDKLTRSQIMERLKVFDLPTNGNLSTLKDRLRTFGINLGVPESILIGVVTPPILPYNSHMICLRDWEEDIVRKLMPLNVPSWVNKVKLEKYIREKIRESVSPDTHKTSIEVDTIHFGIIKNMKRFDRTLDMHCGDT